MINSYSVINLLTYELQFKTQWSLLRLKHDFSPCLGLHVRVIFGAIVIVLVFSSFLAV